MRGKVFGYLALIISGVGIYLTGFAFGELQRHRTDSIQYFEGYRTGYIKGYRKSQKNFLQQTSYEGQPLKLNGYVAPSDESSAVASDNTDRDSRIVQATSLDR